MPEFFFQRYVNGERMADDVLITKQATLEDAIPAASRLCRNSPKSVLVYVPEDSARLRDEITRLRTDLAAVTAERDRMRTLLTRLYDAAGPLDADKMPADDFAQIITIVLDARAAIEGVTDKKETGNE